MAKFCHAGKFLHKKYVCSCGILLAQCPCTDGEPKDVVELYCLGHRINPSKSHNKKKSSNPAL